MKDAIGGFFFFIALAAVILILVIGLIVLAVQTLFVALLVFSIALIVGGLIFLLIYFLSLEYIRKSGDHCKIVTISFEGTEIKENINETELAQFANTRYVPFYSVMTIVAFLIFLLIAWKNLPIFTRIPSPWTDTYVPTGIIIAFVVGWCFVFISALLLKVNLDDVFKKMIRNKLLSSFDGVHHSIKNYNHLKKIVDEIKQKFQKFHLRFTDEYMPPVEDFITNNSVEILKNPTDLQNLIDEQLFKAEDDNQNLDIAIQKYDSVLALYDKVQPEVQKGQKPSVIDLTDKIFKGLNGLIVYIPQRKWSEFIAKVDEAYTLLESIYSNVTGSEYVNQSNEEKDYHELGISKEMSFEQIRKVYRQLIKIYHPDKGLVPNDTKFKNIQSAFERIKSKLQPGFGI